MSRERAIGSVSTQQYTKSEFIKLIDRNFPDNKTGSIAVVVTTNYGDYDQPTVMQGITFGKILNDSLLYSQNVNSDSIKDEAVWKMWSGWTSNHDKRIEDATCSKCGYKHPVVKGSLSFLNTICPYCNSQMVAVKYENTDV